MKRMRRDNLIKRTAAILGNNEGASLVLVSILAILVLLSVVILRLATTTFMASSNRQLNQDQAYELAASLGSSIDALIENGDYDLDAITEDKMEKDNCIYYRDEFSGLPNSSVMVEVDVDDSNHTKTIIITAKVKNAQYVYTKEYAA